MKRYNGAMRAFATILLIFLALQFRSEGKLQGQMRIDSLREELENSLTDDTTKARLMANLSFLLVKVDVDEAEALANKGVELSERLGFPAGKALCLRNLAIIKGFAGDNLEAVNLLFQAEDLAIGINDITLLANIYINIGIIFTQVNELDKALEYFEKSLEICLATGNKHVAASNYNNIASIRAKKKDYSTALGFYQKALDLYVELDLQTNIAGTLNNIGNNYNRMKNYDEAYKCYLQSLDISNKYKDNSGRMYSLGNLADLFNEVVESDSESAGRILAKEGGRRAIINKAIEYASTAAEIASDQVNKNTFVEWKKVLAQSYFLSGDYEKAYLNFQEMYNVKDSLLQNENKASIEKLEARKNAELKQKEIDLLRKDKEFSTLLTIVLSIASLAAIAFVIHLVRYLKKKDKINSLLIEKNKIIEDAFHELSAQNDTIIQTKNELELLNEGLVEREHELMTVNATKDKFFSIIAHDLKNPLGAMIGASNALIKLGDEFSDDEKNEMYGVIAASSEHLYSLLENLLTWARSQTGTIEFHPNVKTLKFVVDDTIALHQLQAENKNIIIESNIDDSIQVFADSQMIHTVLRNLVSNAIKFTAEGGKIRISARILSGNNHKKHVELRVTDNGIGMDESEVARLFRIDGGLRGQGTNSERGTGLGLIVCREFVEKNGGTIWASSKPNHGTTFSFTLPLYDYEAAS